VVLDAPTSPAPETWVPVPEGSDFPLENLPYGILRRKNGVASVAVAIGDHVLDLGALQRAGLLDLPGLTADAMLRKSLNAFMATGPATWRAVREQITRLLAAGEHLLADDTQLRDRALLERRDVELLLPFEVGDYVDFSASAHHARNMGTMLRPGTEPLPSRWWHQPLGYHGRAGSVIVSGTPVHRPRGQVLGDDGRPEVGASRMLDFELEVGFVVGVGNERGHPITVDTAAGHVFGLVLVNDWSARDLQAFEQQPLGPFLGKSFATTVSPWVVTLDALRPYFTARPNQEPPPGEYLHETDPWGVDLQLEVDLLSVRMHGHGADALVVTRVSFDELHWTIPQLLAHATVNGAPTRPGDLFASGTVSGPEPGSWGSLMEASWGGTRPLPLGAGETRSFLEDGDSVRFRGWCERSGRPRIGLGELTGTVLAA
jgi:fumarylacetoacetase